MYIYMYIHIYIHIYIQGGAVNRGLKWLFQCVDPPVFLKLILGLKSTGWYVLANHLFSSNFILTGGSGMSSSFCWYAAASRPHSAARDGHRELKFGVSCCLAFPLQNVLDREVQRIQVRQICQHICRNPEFRWQLLSGPGGWTSAISAERCIFCQDKSPEPRGPYAISKKLGRRRRQHIHRRKLAISSSTLHFTVFYLMSLLVMVSL
jgi:hypothetical protein